VPESERNMTMSDESLAQGQPSLDELLAQFVRAWPAETATQAIDASSEVVPFQAATLFAPDPRAALNDGIEVAGFLLDQAEVTQFQRSIQQAPPDWSSLVRSQPSVLALPFCLGNFPQMVRSVTPLLTGMSLRNLRPQVEQPLEIPGLQSWGQERLGKSRWAEALVAVAAMRLAQQMETAQNLLARIREAAPATWQPLILNETAALAWHAAQSDAAEQLWNDPMLRDTVVGSFNRGLAALFNDRPREAAELLLRAAQGITENSSWHQLARLYGAVAQTAGG
jgi:hypothetical protein